MPRGGIWTASLQIVKCLGVQKRNCKLDFPVVSEHNSKQIPDGEKPWTVRVLPREDSGQEM